MFNSLIAAFIAACKAYEEHCKLKRLSERRELRQEQARLRESIVNAARDGNSSLIDELQNQLESSYADADALRNAGSDSSSEGN